MKMSDKVSSTQNQTLVELCMDVVYFEHHLGGAQIDMLQKSTNFEFLPVFYKFLLLKKMFSPVFKDARPPVMCQPGFRNNMLIFTSKSFTSYFSQTPRAHKG